MIGKETVSGEDNNNKDDSSKEHGVSKVAFLTLRSNESNGDTMWIA